MAIENRSEGKPLARLPGGDDGASQPMWMQAKTSKRPRGRPRNDGKPAGSSDDSAPDIPVGQPAAPIKDPGKVPAVRLIWSGLHLCPRCRSASGPFEPISEQPSRLVFWPILLKIKCKACGMVFSRACRVDK